MLYILWTHKVCMHDSKVKKATRRHKPQTICGRGVRTNPVVTNSTAHMYIARATNPLAVDNDDEQGSGVKIHFP